MRQITALFMIVGLIMLIGCNLATTINSPVGILCIPLSFGVAMFFIISVLEHKKYYYDYTYYDDTASLLTQRMYNEGTVGHAITTHVSTIIGTGLTFFITHGIITTYSSQIITNTNLSSFTAFLINTVIIATIILITALIIHLKNHQAKIHI